MLTIGKAYTTPDDEPGLVISNDRATNYPKYGYYIRVLTEEGDGSADQQLRDLRALLDAAGVEFVVENEAGS